MEYKTVKLGTLISPAKTVRCGNKDYPVLSMTMHNGLVFQEDKFKKVIASKDTSDYKVVFRNQLVISFPIDEGVLAIQRITDAGIVSPTYGIWDIDQNQIIPEFLENALRCERAINYYKAKLRGSTARRRSLPTPTLLEFDIPLPTIEEQNSILDIMNKVKRVLECKEDNLRKLDCLIKARFVEMFGTLDNPSQEFEKATLKELCNKITDGKHGGCIQEEGTNRYFVGAREIYDDEIHYETAPQINIAEFEKDYKRCNVEIGDFLIVNTGATIGKSAIASDIRTTHTLLQKSVALLKVKQEALNPVFLKWCYRVNTKMYLVESASAQPNLLLSKINSTIIYVPDINLQNEFAIFVEQVDKSKFVVQKSLEETKLLIDSLMQEYFG